MCFFMQDRPTRHNSRAVGDPRTPGELAGKVCVSFWGECISLALFSDVYTCTRDKHARHFIYVDGNTATFTLEYDSNISEQSGATSIVMKLVTGQQVHTAMFCNVPGTIDNTPEGSGNHIRAWFEVALLHLD